MGSDIIHINQPGKIEGSKVRLGQMVTVPLDPDQPEGPKRLSLKLGRISVKLGNGIELSDVLQPMPGCVALAVTAEAAKRMGWPHPANDQAKPGPADIGRLHGIVASDSYGQQERLAALHQIREIDPERGRTLAAAFAWLEAA